LQSGWLRDNLAITPKAVTQLPADLTALHGTKWETTKMAEDHYLAGSCEGMNINRDGATVELHDNTGREPFKTETFETEQEARIAQWKWAEFLHEKYDNPSA